MDTQRNFLLRDCKDQRLMRKCLRGGSLSHNSTDVYRSECLGDEGVWEVLGSLWYATLTIHCFKFIFMHREEKSQKNPRKMDQRLINEAEHNNLLRTLEKNMEIPQDCTYANQKAIDEEVSS